MPLYNNWEELENACENCVKCELHSARTKCVFGCGPKNAALMFIGEAPGEKEDLSGVPFVGAAGKLFDKFLAAVGISRDEIYIANMLKCRPPNNRDPLPEEQDKCIDYLRSQVSLIKPAVIVCLGRVSAMRLIKPDFKITSEHGVWVGRGNYKMCAVYHPALLLRDPRRKEDMLIDMKSVKAALDEANGINGAMKGHGGGI